MTCTAKDSDSCLQKSPNWGPSYKCADYTTDCSNWAKDMRRCCPVTCNTGQFSEEVCNSISGTETCIHPNDAQCNETCELSIKI